MFLSKQGTAAAKRESRFRNVNDPKILGADLEATANELSTQLLDINFQVHRSTVVIATGGDFEEFGLPVLKRLDPEESVLVGCLWPVHGSDESKLFFEQEYFEPEARGCRQAIIAVSIANDYSFLQPLLRRVRELLPHADLIVVSACATVEIHERLLSEDIRMIAAVIRSPNQVDYWTSIKALDLRPVTVIPRMTRWLLNRMEVRAALRAEYENERDNGDFEASEDALDIRRSEQDQKADRHGGDDQDIESSASPKPGRGG